MIEYAVKDILKTVNGTLLSGKNDMIFKGVSIDSRTLETGQLFFCISGEHFDGHDFIKDAVRKKAAGIIIENKEKIPQDLDLNNLGCFAIQVKDALQALQECARFHRSKMNLKIVAITGTNGKTTTKEMAASIAETKFSTLKTLGNLNNHIGLPLTLFNLESNHEAAVLEMGMSAAGEIRKLAEIALPDIGLITNISQAHLTELKTVRQVQQVKGELFEKLGQDATAIVNADDTMVLELANSLRSRIITYAIENKADVKASDIRTRGNAGYDFTLNVFDRQADLFLPYPGQFNIYNALAAVAVGHSLGIELESFQTGLTNCRLPDKRLEISFHHQVTLINDAYNANPKSMSEALNFLLQFKTPGRRFLVIGNMLELGPIEHEAHQRFGEQVSDSAIDFFVTVGDLARKAGERAIEKGMARNNIMFCDNHEQAADYLKDKTRSGDCVLFKGSRGARMENVIHDFTGNQSMESD